MVIRTSPHVNIKIIVIRTIETRNVNIYIRVDIFTRAYKEWELSKTLRLLPKRGPIDDKISNYTYDLEPMWFLHPL